MIHRIKIASHMIFDDWITLFHSLGQENEYTNDEIRGILILITNLINNHIE